MPNHFRHYPRQAVTLRAAIAHPMAGWQREIDVVDLGIAGAGLSSPDPFELSEGERVTISFHAPTLWDPLTLTARVAWVQKGRAGVAFEHKTPPSAYALLELLTNLQP